VGIIICEVDTSEKGDAERITSSNSSDLESGDNLKTEWFSTISTSLKKKSGCSRRTFSGRLKLSERIKNPSISVSASFFEPAKTETSLIGAFVVEYTVASICCA